MRQVFFLRGIQAGAGCGRNKRFCDGRPAFGEDDMNTTGAREIGHRTTRPLRRNSTAHLYSVGQAVRLTSGFIHPFRTGGVHHVVRTLPPSGGVPQYRIRNEREGYERVAAQGHLEPADHLPGDPGSALPDAPSE